MYASVKNPDGTNLFPQNYDAAKWKTAADAAYKIIDGNLYQLYHSDDDDPYDNYYGITQEKWNSELIWTTGSKGRFIMSAHTCPTSVAGSSSWGLSGLLSNKWMPIQWQRQVGFLLQVMNQTVVL